MVFHPIFLYNEARGDYMFREIEKEEVQKVYELILDRIEWMNENDIHQWNETNYTDAYPLSYYEEKREKGQLFGLIEEEHIVCAAVLLEEDERWNDSIPSLYVHNLVSSRNIKGAGKRFFACLEDYAHKQGKKYIRLDSARDNPSLTSYYTSLGFIEVGTCIDGPYKGICRQKEVHY